MASSPLPILLLIAVAFSQVFGGVSCCCLSRSLFLDWGSSSSNSDMDSKHCDPLKPSKRSGPGKTSSKCPRCSAAKTATPAPSKDSKPISGIVCKSNGSEQCQCTRYVAAAELATWTKSVPQTFLDWSLLTDVATQTLPSTTRALICETVPLHPSGVSWQAYACIWTT